MAVKSVLDRLISSRDIQFSTLLHVQTRRMHLDFVVNLCVTVTVLTPRSPAACILSLTDSSFILTMKEIMVRRLFKTYLHLQFLSESKKKLHIILQYILLRNLVPIFKKNIISKVIGLQS